MRSLKEWGDRGIMLALDTTLLFKRWCVICVSLTYKGRALPLSWRIIEHSSSMVSIREIHPVLSSVQCLLSHLPHLEAVCINADRGFCDQELMSILSDYGWHWNIRGKGQIYLFDAKGQPLQKFRQQLNQHGHMVIHHNVYITSRKYGPVDVAAVLPCGAKDPWFIITNQHASRISFSEYHERTQIEEGFRDLKSGGFDLEKTRLNSAGQLEVLFFLLGLADLFLLSEGVATVAAGQRRRVDTHWFRGLSYVQIGWRSIRRALTERKPFLEKLYLPLSPDPEPSRRRSCPLYLYLIRGFS